MSLFTIFLPMLSVSWIQGTRKYISYPLECAEWLQGFTCVGDVVTVKEFLLFLCWKNYYSDISRLFGRNTTRAQTRCADVANDDNCPPAGRVRRFYGDRRPRCRTGTRVLCMRATLRARYTIYRTNARACITHFLTCISLYTRFRIKDTAFVRTANFFSPESRQSKNVYIYIYIQ